MDTPGPETLRVIVQSVRKGTLSLERAIEQVIGAPPPPSAPLRELLYRYEMRNLLQLAATRKCQLWLVVYSLHQCYRRHHEGMNEGIGG